MLNSQPQMHLRLFKKEQFKTKERQISPDERQQIIDELRLI